MRTPRVLVVDDEPEFCRLASRHLAHTGFDCHTFTCGAEGLKFAAAQSPEAILLDIFMPGLNGFTILKALRMDQRTSAIPVILVTGDLASAHIMESASENMNVSAFVRKPVDWTAMAALIRRAIRAVSGSIDPDVIVREPLRVDVKLRRAFVKDVDLDLGRRRFDILLVLAQRRGGATALQLAAAFQGATNRKAIHTIVQTAGRLREDLRHACGREMIVNIPGGYKLL